MLKIFFAGIFFLMGAEGFSKNSLNKEMQTSLPREISKLFSKRVHFWEKIFTWWDDSYLIIHNKKYPWIIYKVINKADYVAKGFAKNLTDPIFKELSNIYIQETQAKLKILAKMKNPNQLKDSSLEKLARKFKSLSKQSMQNTFAEAASADQFRVQVGMKKIARTAFEKSEKYFPRMEKIFQKFELPVELTRIPFIESMFQEKATSFVGARGLWQLMPKTARELGLIVLPQFDERLDFLASTLAAAKFFSQQYSLFGEWPLAVTSYNHGPNGISRAIEQVKSKNLQEIIDRYEAGSFGFASENFYAELIAILNIEKKIEVVWDDLKFHKPDQFKSIHLKESSRLDRIFQIYQVSNQLKFMQLNPAIQARIEPFLTLPKNLLVHIPVP